MLESALKNPIAGDATVEEERLTIFIAKLNTEETIMMR
jgi:hypothetical protein